MKISLKNYQSIRNGELEVQGLTGVIGVNNQGKTAIMRAIRDACLNTFTLDKVTVGTPEGEITLNDLVLRRAKSTTLIYKNSELSKLDGKKILKLVDNSDFVLVDNDKISNCLPQLQFQREQLFPFSLTPSQIYYLFSMLFDIETVNKMMMKVKDTVKEVDNQLKYLKGKSDEIVIQENRHAQLQANLPDRDRLSKIEFKVKHLNRLEEVGRRFDTLAARKSYLSSLPQWTAKDEARPDFLALLKASIKKQEIQSKLNAISVAGPEKLRLGLLAAKKARLQGSLRELKLGEYKLAVLRRYMSDQQRDDLKVQMQEIQGQLAKVKVCPACQRPL